MAVSRTRASVVCVDGDELLCVSLRDPVSEVARLYIPGGKVEPAETPSAAAAREALEETGYRVEVDGSSESVSRYPFVWAGVDVDVTTHFFRGQLLGPREAPQPVDDADYNEGVVWLPLARLEEALGFHSTILACVQALVDDRY